MFDRKEIKSRAKLVLANSYFMTFIACMIVSVISSGALNLGIQRIQAVNLAAMSNLRLIATCAVIVMMLIFTILFYVFLVLPLTVGLKKFMLGSADGDMNLNQLIFPFKNEYKNIVLTQLIRRLIVFLWSLPAVIPWIIGIWKFDLLERTEKLALQTANNSVSSAVSLLLIMSLMFLLTAILSVPSVIKELQYSMTEYILAEEPDAQWRDVLTRSKELMVGNKWAYAKLLFSFAGWYIAANLFCCIGNFLLTPYIQASVTQMYLHITGRGGQSERYKVYSEF